MISAKQYVKKTTTVPEAFIDELFEFYNNESIMQTDFVIKLSVVAKWLAASKYKLVKTLKRSYKKDLDYTVIKPIDYIKKDNRANNYKEYMLTPDCFKRLALMSKSKNAELVRSYFIEVESLFLKYRDQTLLGMQKDIERMERNKRIIKKIQPKKGYVYIIRASEKHEDIYKLGRSGKFVDRLRTYNTGRMDDVDVLYVYETPDIKSTEQCIKVFLKQYQLKKYKELYQADLTMIKEFMKGCSALSAKLIHKEVKTKTSGGYFMVIDEAPST